MKTAPLLSIGMIFKNEARCLERCLQSLGPLRQAVPCELIMADTGSDDGSREIARRYADEVFDFVWTDDFAAARNAVMDRCSGKWYFSVDCDEWLNEDIHELLAFLKGGTVDFAFVLVRNYETAELEKSEAFDDFRAMRLMRMSTGRRFNGAIHESLRYYEPAERLTHTILHHDGYVYTNPEIQKKKMRRNMKLLRRMLEQQPEDPRILLQCIESGRQAPDFLSYVRRGVAAIQAQKEDWQTYGPCILRHAVNLARISELPEMDEWIRYAERQFPDSIFTQVDLNYSVLLSARDAKEWEKAIRYGEAYRRGLQILRAEPKSQELEEELGHSDLMFGSKSMERYALIGLADVYLQAGQGEKALAILAGLEGQKLDREQVRIAVVAFCELHAQTLQDVAPFFSAFYDQIHTEEPNARSCKARLSMFDSIAAVAFTKKYQKEEQDHIGYHRPAYGAFRCLAEKCEAGRAAAILMTEDPAEMRNWLLAVEDWQALPIEALEHALQAGVTFPMQEKPLPIEVLDGLAVLLTHGANPARQMVLAQAENQEYPRLQSLYWAQSLALAALQSFDWSLGKNNASASKFACPENKKEPDERPEDTPETGFAIIRKFAQIESTVLPLLYAQEMLCEENAALLPPVHRWGLYCSHALQALDGGDPQEYLAFLRRGLKACPGQKEMVQFMLDRFQEDARPKANPELLTLAEQVRKILSAYDPADPAVAALKASPAYQQVAYLIEDKNGNGQGTGIERKKMRNQEFLGSLGSYAQMSKMLKTYDYEEILKQASALAKIESEKLEQYPMGGYSKGMTSGAYRFVLKDLLAHIEDYDWLYSRFEDDISREVFTHLIRYRLFPDNSFLVAAYDAEHPHYYDKTIIKCNDDEVFVDCGAYNGDSTEKFIKYYGAYKHIYAYEPSTENIQACRNNLKKYPHVTVRQCGVGEKSAVLCMDSNGASSTFMRKQRATAGNGIPIISLDEDIPEGITYCKMDIEGFEIPALLGAKRHIRDDFPKLAISVYHIVTDIWEIPRLIDSIHPGYRFFIRHYDPKHNWETVIYAIPPEKE